MVIGAYAMGVYGYPRATGDFDIWVEVSVNNSRRIYKSLSEFKAPLKGVNECTFLDEGIVFQIGVPPRRIDMITQIDGVTFADAYKRKKRVRLEGVEIPVISFKDLVKNKKSTGREKDRLDVKHLMKVGEA